MILTRLSDDGTWSEICVNDMDIPLINLGIDHRSTISIEEKVAMNENANSSFEYLSS